MARKLVANQDNTSTSSQTEPLTREVARPIFGESVLAIDYNFAEKDYLDDDIDFSRSSGATQNNSSGLVAFARNNLHEHSTGVNATTFGGLNMEAHDANFATAPDGTTTAARARPTSATARHELYTFYDSVANSIYSSSIYVKPLGSITHISFTWAGSGSVKVVFDIVNGTAGSTGTDILGKSITHVGDGWMRMNIVFKAVNTGNTKNYLSLGEADSSNSTYSNVAGDGTKGILYWGAQTEQILSAQDEPLELIHTDGAAYQAPRFDYTKDGDKKGLLIEEARTNYVPYSQEFSQSDWIKQNSSIATSGETDPSGGTGAYKLTLNTNDSSARIHDAFSSTAGEHTFSVYVKKGTASDIRVGFNDEGTAGRTMDFNLETGQVIQTSGASNTFVQDCGNGWYRIGVSGNIAASGSDTFFLRGFTTNSNTSSGDYLYIFGAQMEKGSLSSLIPTYGSTASRSADIAEVTGTNFSRFYKDTEGTFVIDAQVPKGFVSDNSALFSLSDNSSSDHIRIYMSTSEKPVASVRTLSSGQASISTNVDVSSGEIFTSSLGYKTNDTRAFTDHGTSNKDTSVDLPTNLIQLTIGHRYGNTKQLNGWIRRLRYFNKRKSDAQLQNLVSQDKLLQRFKGAKAAHSLRALTDFDKQKVVSVRREYDSYEADYTAAQVSNGDLEKDFRSADQTTLPLDVSVEADEMIVNGGFDSTTAPWGISTGGQTVELSGGGLRIATDGTLAYVAQGIPVVKGKTYRITGDIRVTSGSGSFAFLGEQYNYNSTQSFSVDIVSNVTSANSNFILKRTSGGSASDIIFDNISVKEVNPIATGFSTRKINSDYTGYAMRVRNNDDNIEAEVSFDSNDEISLDSPVKATSMNLLAFSEDFGQWSTYNAGTVTSGQADPFGGNNASKIISPNASAYNGIVLNTAKSASDTNYTFSYYQKKDSTQTNLSGFEVSYNGVSSKLGYYIVNPSTGTCILSSSSTAGVAASINVESVNDDWWRISATQVDTGANTNVRITFYPGFSSNGTTIANLAGEMTIYGAQLEETVYESTPSGTELVTNGDFAASAGWTALGDAVIGSGVATIDGTSQTSSVYQNTTVQGRRYTVTYTVSSDNGTGTREVIESDGTVIGLITGNGTFSHTWTQGHSSGNIFFRARNGGSYVLDNVSVKELANLSPKEYTQTPVISDAHNSTSATNLREFAGKENLIRKSEDFSSNWINNNLTITADTSVTDPFGGTGAFKCVKTGNGSYQRLYDYSKDASGANLTGNAGDTYTFSVYVKPTGTTVGLRITATGTSSVFQDFTVTPNVWQRLSFSHTTTGAYTDLKAYLYPCGTGADNDSTTGGDAHIFGAQVNTNSLKDYQKTEGSAKTADVHVVTWYDQGGGEDATQSTAGNQPRIVKGAELVTDSGGKAALDFDADHDNLYIDQLAGHQRLDAYYVVDPNVTKYSLASSYNSPTAYFLIAENGSSVASKNNSGDPNYFVNGSSQSGTRNDFHDVLEGDNKVVGVTNIDTSAWVNFQVGEYWTTGSASFSFGGTISEMVFFPNINTSPKRFNIEQNMIQHFMDGAIYSEDFNDDTGGWVDTDSGGSSTTLSHETTNPISGSGSLKIALSNTGTSGGYPRVRKSTGTAFRTGIKYRLSFKAKLLSGTAKADIRFGTASTNMYFKAQQAFSTDEQTYSYTETFDTLPTSGTDSIDFLFNGTLGPFELLIDDVKVEEVGVEGYVTKLYDQTGNNCHALQSTAAEQPQIVSGGDLIKSGNHPAWYYRDKSSGNDDVLSIPSLAGISRLDAFFVHDSGSDGNFMYPTGGSGQWGMLATNGSTNSNWQNFEATDSAIVFVNGTQGSPTNRGGLYNLVNGRKLVHHQNVLTAAWTAFNISDYNELGVSTNNLDDFKFCEWIWYDSDQSSNRTGIESNINTHYNIY